MTSKTEFLKAWKRNLLGNRPQVWETAGELERSGWKGLVNLRSTVVGHRCFSSHLPVSEALFRYWNMVGEGFPASKLYFGESTDESTLVFQGEVYLSERGLYLYASTVKGLNCRDAMRDSRSFSLEGLEAKLWLTTLMSPPAYDDLLELLESYPGAVVELSTFRKKVGWAEGRNTVIWEVRTGY